MANAVYPPYPPTLTQAEQEYLLTNLKDWSITHGLAVRPTSSYVAEDLDPARALATTAPATLFPSLFPRSCFEQARAVSQAYSELYSAIAADEEWLSEIVKELLEIDDFIEKLWKVHLAVKKEGYAQSLQLGLFRSDYMGHVSDSDSDSRLSVKQVEFNTIASSFGGLSSQVAALHRYLHSVDAYPEVTSSLINDASLQSSGSVPELASGLAKAHQAYVESERTDRPVCVLFLVQDVERNVFDQRHLEYALNTDHGIRTFRLPFSQVLQDTSLDKNRKLLYTPPSLSGKQWEVSVVYFRAGYAPTEYTAQRDWDARLHIERSAAIKCPGILTHLAGSKKVQQVLATPHSPHLARFLPDKAAADKLLATFAPIYPLDDSEAGLEARKLATDPQTAQKYVLKPQREGGGNNIYRSEIPGFLQNLPKAKWPAYILMEMIEPPTQGNAIFRNGEVQSGEVICELGVYGACLWRDKVENGVVKGRDVLENFEAGYLLRTKGAGSSEGGVAAGFGSVDSCCLLDL
nr:hypothetical protein B0A51_13210 [Rachicladosporium sp. CCFEE 5018]